MAKAAEYVERMQQQDTDILHDWPIHHGFLMYTLEDIAHEDCVKTLNCWLRLFTPSRQPQSDEELFYVQQMAAAIERKLSLLNNKCM